MAKQTDWEHWVITHAPGLFLFARQRSRCEADAQDLVQEAVVEAWQRQADGAPPPLALVFATIRRRAADWGRSQDRRAAREAVAHAENRDCWFDSSIEDRDLSRLIQEATRKLQENYREVVTLKTWGGLTFAEIAEALEIPANTGTYVIVANPKKHLTAHDKEGKLSSDGEVETSEQQEKVPKDVWKKVQPMIEQLNQAREDAPATAEPAPEKTSALPAGKRRFHSSHMLADLRTYVGIVQYLLEPEYPMPATFGTNHLALAPEWVPVRG